MDDWWKSAPLAEDDNDWWAAAPLAEPERVPEPAPRRAQPDRTDDARAARGLGRTSYLSGLETPAARVAPPAEEDFPTVGPEGEGSWLSGLGRAVGRGATRLQGGFHTSAGSAEARALSDMGKTVEQIAREIDPNIDRASPEVRYRVMQEAQRRVDTAEALGGEYAPQTQERAVTNLMRGRALAEQAAAIPMSEPASDFRNRFMAADNTVGGVLEAFASDPVGGAAFVTEVAAEFTPVLAGATVASTVSPAAGLSVMGLGSLQMEAGAEVDQFLAEHGADLSTREGALAAIENPELMQEARDRGLARGVIISSLDVLSGGIAGKALARSPVGDLALQTLVQMTAGSSGEAGAQLATDGEIDVREVMIEGLAEVATLPIEVGGVMRREAFGDRRDRERRGSPRLTPADRASPIPNDVIDDGKAILDAVTRGAPLPSKAARQAPEQPEAPAEIPEGAVPLETLYGTETEVPEGSKPEIPPETVRQPPAGGEVDAGRVETPAAPDAAPGASQGLYADDVKRDVRGNRTDFLDDQIEDPRGNIGGIRPDTQSRQDAYMAGVEAALEGATSPPTYGDDARTTLAMFGYQKAKAEAEAFSKITVPPRAQPTAPSGEPVESAQTGQTVQNRGIEVLGNDEIARIETDPRTFQYKAGADEVGVTDRLRGVETWDTRRAGIGVVYEYADGRRVIVDGHQRLALAKRAAAAGQTVDFPVHVLRERDGITPAEARVIGAEKNIAEGSGSALDAAKVLRDTGKTAKELGLPPSSAIVRDGDGLARLSDDAFGMVVNEVASERDGAIVGRLVEDPARHADVLGLLAKLKPANATQAEAIIRQAAEAEVVETQTSLFGDEEVSQNLYLERAKVLDRALRDLGRDIQTFKTLTDRGDTIAGEGNVLAADKNAARLSADAEARARLMKQANTKGAVSDALTEAARAVREGKPVAQAARDFVEAVRRAESGVRPEGPQAGGPRRSPEPAQGPASPEGESSEVAPSADDEADRFVANPYPVQNALSVDQLAGLAKAMGFKPVGRDEAQYRARVADDIDSIALADKRKAYAAWVAAGRPTAKANIKGAKKPATEQTPPQRDDDATPGETVRPAATLEPPEGQEIEGVRAFMADAISGRERNAAAYADVEPIRDEARWKDEAPHAERVFPAPAVTRKLDVELRKGGFISPEEAARRLAAWKAEAARQGREEDHSNEAIISLFDHTGAWSKPFEEAGFRVLRYDVQSNTWDDLIEFFPSADLAALWARGIKVRGVMSACPCTTFAGSGARWWKTRHDVADNEMVEKMFGPVAARYFDTPRDVNEMLVRITEAVVDLANPDWHVLENPVGRIASETGLPEPTLTFHPHNFGDPYTKRTMLWGDFNTDLPTANVKPVEGSKMQSKLRGDRPEDKIARSTTPEGFSYAFFMAQEARAAAATQTEQTPEGEQTVVPGVTPITRKDRDRAAIEKGQQRPLKGRDEGPGSGRDDLFGNPEDRRDLFDAPQEPTKGETAAEPGLRRGEVGMKLASGERVLTTTGRETTPFPKIALGTERKASKTLKSVDRWLMQNAVDEARARGDDFNARIFEQNLERPSQADKDSAEAYLFDPDFNSALKRETITPATDTLVGRNDAGEQIFERADGSRYRMRMDRRDRPGGYPDFGGDLVPVETASDQGEKINTPERLRELAKERRAAYEEPGDERAYNAEDLLDSDETASLFEELAAAEGLEARIEITDRWVLESGRKREAEVVVVLDKDGVPVEIAGGVRSAVNVGRGAYRRAEAGEIGHVSHNHPRSTGFSAKDYGMAFYGFSPLVAMGHNGDRHWMRALHTVALGQLRPAIEAVDAAGEYVRQRLQAMVYLGTIEADAASRLQWALVSLSLDRAGVIEYRGRGRDIVGEEGLNHDDFHDGILAAAADGLRRAGLPVAEGGDREGTRSAEGPDEPQPGGEPRDSSSREGTDGRDREGRVPGQAVTGKPSDRIEDFGQKIEGAAKDRWRAFVDKLDQVADEDVRRHPLSKTFPAPDYQALLDDGVDPWIVAFVRAARDLIPQKPRGWKLRGWVDQVIVLRDFSKKLLEGVHSRAAVEEKLAGEGFERLRDKLTGSIDLYLAVGHDKSLKGLNLEHSSYTMKDGKYHNPPLRVWEVTAKAKATAFSNMPKVLASGETKDAAIEAFRAVHAAMDADPAKGGKRSTSVRFDIYRRPATGKYHIGKKIGHDYLDLETFDTVQEARDYRAAHQEELERKLERMKDVPNERRDTNAPRVGADHRNGADVTPEQFSDTFGFRGVQFGNYVEGDRRQQDLNQAYDALLDLAGILNIDPKALSLNGELGLAFGARGKGGKNAPMAHYEPGQVVINLTKKKGAGSLAHEWFHGLDNYFERKRQRPSEYVTNQPSPRRGEGPDLRPALLEAFQALRQAINQTKLAARSLNIDRTRSKAYWSTTIEMHARAFENYVITKLADLGGSNDYLANILDEESWNALARANELPSPSYPYLLMDELPKVRAAFDNLFQTIETRETDTGLELFEQQRIGTGQPEPATGPEGTIYEIMPEVEARAEEVSAAVREELRKAGLPQIGVKVLQRIFANLGGKRLPIDGYFLDGVIRVALENSQGAISTARHETIHALRSAELWSRETGLFRPAEWKVLERAARADKALMARVKADYGHLDEAGQVEEAIAEMYVQWTAGRLKAKGFLADAFRRIRNALTAMRNALRGLGFQTPESVFERVRQGEVGARAGEMGAGTDPRFQVAYHGSPHSFDRFSSEHIGRGEGAQAYGWGLYFASKREVAEHYRGALSERQMIGAKDIRIPEGLTAAEEKDVRDVFGGFWGMWNLADMAREIRKARDEVKPSRDYVAHLERTKAEVDEGNADLIREFPEIFAKRDENIASAKRSLAEHEQAARVADLLDRFGVSAFVPEGRLYEVDVPEDSEMLDWDKPLSEQPEAVKEALKKLRLPRSLRGMREPERSARALLREMLSGSGMQDRTGAALYRWLAGRLGKPAPAGSLVARVEPRRTIPDDRAASEMLRQAGIPGHRYLDGGSRSAGDGTYNYVVYDDSRIETRARFAISARERTTNEVAGGLAETPVDHGVIHTTDTAARQESFLKAIASQPIDQAFRIPFALFGGLDSAGRWTYGREGYKRLSKAITDQPIGFLTPLAEKVRHGLIDRHGLPEDYVERERQRGVDEALIMGEGREYLEALMDRDMDASEARVLQAVLTGEAVGEADMAQLAQPIREAIDRLGAEAVELGLLSAEAYERNRGTYLHRVYEKHELDDSAAVNWINGIFAKRRRRIIGNQFKGRGIFEEVGAERILKDNEEFLGARRGKPQKGDRIIILDVRSTTGTDGLPEMESPRGRLKRRVYWPAETPIPASLDNYENRGTFEVRGERKGRIVLWRDFTREERQQMGEILDARYTIGKTFAMMARDLATGRLFNDIAKNEEWSRAEPPADAKVDEEPQEGSWLKRMWVDPSVEWVKVPTAKIPKSDTYRYGALAGRYVRADIWRDLEELRAMQSPNFWSKLLTQWKLNKTARSPVVHMNNVMSNFLLMDMADVRVPDLIEGIREMAKGGEVWREAAEAGAFGADMVSQELRQNVLMPMLDEIRKQVRSGRGGLEAEIGSLGRVLDTLIRWAKKADQTMVSAYQMEDQIFRMATYIRRRQQGYTVDEAAVEARDQFLNYDIRAPWVNAARRSVLPFIAYTYRAVPKVAQTVAERPWKLGKYFAFAYAVNALSYALAPSDWDEDEERKSLRESEEGRTWVGVERMVRMPYLSDGNPVFLDIRRWVPAGDVFDTGGGDIPAWLQLGGPLAIGFELYLNKSAFTDDEIVNKLTDTFDERQAKRGEFLYKSWMPSAPWIPGSWYFEKLSRAIEGEALQWGSNTPYSVSEAALSSIGIKMKPKDVETGYLGWRIQFDQVEQELNAQLRSLKRQRKRRMIDKGEYESAAAAVREKLERLKDRKRDRLPRR